MTSVNVDGNVTMETFMCYLTWCVETLPCKNWSTQIGTFTAVNIHDITYPDDVFIFNNADDAVAFKLKFEL